MIRDQIKSIDLAAVVRSAGVELKNSCGRLVALCPFHSEKTPSFFVFPDNRFKCFSCHEHGDPVDFIQRLHGLNFRDALRFLGVGCKPLSGSDLHRINEAKRQRERREIIERSIAYTLATRIRQMNAALEAVSSETMDESACFYHLIPEYEYLHDVLMRGDDSESATVLERLRDVNFIERNKIFRVDFDFPAWLRKFSNGAHNAKKRGARL